MMALFYFLKKKKDLFRMQERSASANSQWQILNVCYNAPFPGLATSH